MKQLILILLAINLIQAQHISNCGSENTTIRFHSVTTHGPDSNELQFYLQGRANADVHTDMLQIRVFGGAPEYTILRTERFSYFASSFFQGEQLRLNDFADFTGLEKAIYHVQVDFLDANDNVVGCALFPQYREHSLE